MSARLEALARRTADSPTRPRPDSTCGTSCASSACEMRSMRRHNAAASWPCTVSSRRNAHAADWSHARSEASKNGSVHLLEGPSMLDESESSAV